MNYENLYSSLSLIKPEITISIFLLLIVIADLIFDKNKALIPFLALAGLIIASVQVILQITNTGYAFPFSDVYLSRKGMVTVDAFGAFFKLIVIISSFVLIYFSYVSDEIKKSEKNLGEYYALIFGMILGMFFLSSASDLILIYVALELLSLSSYVLAGFTKLRTRNSEASLKYLIYGATSSGLMLFGISIFYGLSGTTNLYEINTFLSSHQINQLTLSFASLLIFAGIGYKISSVPFHFWTPDVYEGAPISITAYLSVASKAAGFALLIRFVKSAFVTSDNSLGYWEILSVFDWQSLLILVSILTMTLGNLTALWQNNIKRMLAYSSIAHAGYMLLGVAVLSNQGLVAVLIYFFFYLFMNLGAFFVVMLIANKTGSEELDDYNGLGYTSPFLGVALTLFMIALIGLPPTAGFVGKLYLFIALVDAQMITVAVIALLNTVIALYYYIRVLKHMFLTKSTDETPTVSVMRPNIIFIVFMLAPVLIFGVYFGPVVDFAKRCVQILGL
jgi:NADH-quinone oxidoreductase subunit N